MKTRLGIWSVLVCVGVVGACADAPDETTSTVDEPIVDPTSSGFATAQWTGAWGSDGPIFTGDLNGDHKTDVFMWRNSTHTWTVNLSTGNGFAMQEWTGAWGSDGPIFTGDLNGDGRTDVFMWRAATHSWTVNLSTGGGFVMLEWVGAWGSDGPIFTGDLNGDGKTDVFMWRAVTHSWTINLSTGNGFVMTEWVGAWGSDGPIFTGDLDANGRTDVFMWRDSTKSWTVNLSTGSGFVMVEWFGAWGSDGPIYTGDLNGDGKTDVFMWRAATSSWTVNLSTGGGFAMNQWFGACASDGAVVQGDWNGDGRRDLAVWRDGFKQWMVNLSLGNGFDRRAWNGAWGSDGPINVGDFNGDGRSDILMWRDATKTWMINFGQPVTLGAAATTPACGVPAWGNVGPTHVLEEYSYVPCGGKIDDIQISPSYDGAGTPAMYLASASSNSFLGFGGGGGGIWRSTNFASDIVDSATPTWTQLIDHIPGLTDQQRMGILDVNSIAVDPVHPQTIYASTGVTPPALLRSTDGGTSWSMIAQGQLGGADTVRVSIDPNGIVYVASAEGLYISENSGATFARVSANNVSRLQLSDVVWYSFPNGLAVFVAGVDYSRVEDASNQSGIYTVAKVSGVWTFTPTTLTALTMQSQPFAVWQIFPGGIRMSATPNAGVAATMTRGDNPGLLNVFKVATNGNGAFMWTPQFFMPGDSYTQWEYVQPIGIAPDGRVYGGGIGLMQSNPNGPPEDLDAKPDAHGKTLHVDAHVVRYSPYDQKIYVGTDGGLARFLPVPNQVGTGPNGWETLNTSSLSNMLSESVSFSPANPNDLIVGHQDNGMARSTNGVWYFAHNSNEGEQVYFDPLDATGTTAFAFDASNADFLKSTDHAYSFGKLFNVSGPFVLAFHPTQASRFMVTFMNHYATPPEYTVGGGCTVWETTNNWSSPARNLAPPIAQPTCPKALAYVGSTRYVAAGNRLYQGVDSGNSVTWTNVWQAPSTIVALVGDSANANALYIGTSDGASPGHIYVKRDQSDGLGWVVGNGLRELTGNLPFALRTSGNALALMPSYGRTPTLYAVTNAGVFLASRVNGTATTWSHFGTGLPDVLVSDLKTSPATHGVYAATFGRGVWSLTDYGYALEPLGNGGFETGGYGSWTTAGAFTTITTNGASGSYAAQVGAATPTNGDSTISQTFTLSPTATTLTLRYRIACLDTVTYAWANVKLTDNVTRAVTTIVPNTCTNNGTWVTVNAAIAASAGHSVTLTLLNHDDNYPSDPIYTYFDEIGVN